jgi:pectinesterase
MYYFNHCTIEGHVDLYCPRGNALIENTLFICHSKSAAIWHDGSAHENDKTVLKNCKFIGDPDFKLGRYHREAQMYLIDCKFSENMADAAIYQSGDRQLQWGHRIFYKNCHRKNGDFLWHKDNTSLKKKDLSFEKVFGQNWTKPNLKYAKL